MPLATFHNTIRASRPADASQAPSGLKASARTASVCCLGKTRGGWRIATSQRRMERSSPADARVRPSGVNATARTGAPCPVNAARYLRGTTCQSLTMPSVLADLSALLPAPKATALRASV